MRSVIRQSVTLPASGEKLFDMYLRADLHSAFTGAPVAIGDYPGSDFQAFNGMLSGCILAVIKPKLIVQSWRSVNFGNNDADSTLILMFTTIGDEGQIDLVHLDVPQQDYDGVAKGWEKFYWKPWRVYLETHSA